MIRAHKQYGEFNLRFESCGLKSALRNKTDELNGLSGVAVNPCEWLLLPTTANKRWNERR